MCNRYRNAIRKAGLEFEEWGFEEFSESKIKVRLGDRIEALKEDMYPDYEALVARRGDDGVLVPEIVRWGFPKPFKNGAPQPGYVTNARNIRSDATGKINPYWRPHLAPERRCLVPHTAFSEFSFEPPKGPRWFERADGHVACFAGLTMKWNGLRGTKAKPVEGEHTLFTFLTTDANDLVRPIHAKAMPVILEPEHWEQWLGGTIEEALDLQRPAAGHVLRLTA